MHSSIHQHQHQHQHQPHRQHLLVLLLLFLRSMHPCRSHSPPSPLQVLLSKASQPGHTSHAPKSMQRPRLSLFGPAKFLFCQVPEATKILAESQVAALRSLSPVPRPACLFRLPSFIPPPPPPHHTSHLPPSPTSTSLYHPSPLPPSSIVDLSSPGV
jgi:hypothetical protein